MVKEYIADLQTEFAGYNSKKLSQDLLAGAAVTAVAFPLALAFGLSSGATAAAGMVTAIIAGILIGTFSGASYQVSGPTGAMVAILATVTYQAGLQGLFLAGFLAGIMLVLAGFLKFGKVVEFIPAPVITGFTSGIAVIVAFGEVDNFFGVKAMGENVLTQVFSVFKGVVGGDLAINWYAMGIGLLAIFIMIFWPKKLANKIPASLICVIAALLLNLYFIFPLQVIGEIPKTLILADRLHFADILDFAMIKSLLLPAISIAALAMIESLVCGVSGGRMKGERLRADRELVAQGVGNILLPFLGGIPATAAIARTSMAIKSGGQTRLTVIFHGVGLLLSLFFLGNLMSKIPMSALSGILIVVAFKMNDWASIRYIFGKKIPSAMASYTVTLLATVVLDLAMAIVIGLILSGFFFILRVADIDINVADIDTKKLKERGIVLQNNPEKAKVIYLSGPIFFGAIDRLNIKLSQMEPQDLVIFSMRGVPVIDTSGGQALHDLCTKFLQEDTRVLFSSVQPKVMEMFRIDGIMELIGAENFYWDAEKAILAYDKTN